MSIDTIQHVGAELCTGSDHREIREAILKRNEQINTRFGSMLGRIATVGEVMDLLPESTRASLGTTCVESELMSYHKHYGPIH